MARPSSRASTSIEAVIEETAQRVVDRVSAAVAKHVSALVKQGLERELAAERGRGGGRRSAGRARARVELSRWVADNRARRVPTFVIQATGLDTKKKIVAKFGENAAFEKGKPLPKPKAA